MISKEYGGAKGTIWSLFGAQFGEEFGEVLKLTIRPMTACTWPNRFWKPGRGRNGSKLEKLRNEQVRPLLSTSAVTAKRKVVTYRKQASRMASFGAVRYDREPLSNPYQTHDLCPVDLCPMGNPAQRAVRPVVSEFVRTLRGKLDSSRRIRLDVLLPMKAS